MAYAGHLDYRKIEKDLPGDDGKKPYFNNRTMAKKSLKAYLKGNRFFNYKGKKYAVPTIPDEQTRK